MKIDQRLDDYPRLQAETASAIISIIKSDIVSVFIDEHCNITHHIVCLSQLPYEFPKTEASQKAVFDDLDITIDAFLSEKYHISQHEEEPKEDFFIEDGFLYVPNREGF